MAGLLTKSVISDGDAILNQDQRVKGPKTIFKEFETFLEKHGQIYTLQEVHSDMFLCHGKNRGTLMLFPFKVHVNLSTIIKGGADRQCITNAYAAEFPTDPKEAANQLDANRSLVERAKGMLAPINGKERYLTLGTGHCAAFVKAASAGCRRAESKPRKAAGKRRARGAKLRLGGTSESRPTVSSTPQSDHSQGRRASDCQTRSRRMRQR